MRGTIVSFFFKGEMKNYELLSHTADIRIKAEGSSYTELFEAALLGLCSVLKPDYDYFIEPDYSSIEIMISSYDRTTLLVDFLSEALYEMHNEKVILYSCNLKFNVGNILTVKFLGRKIDAFDKDVKAITYHEAEIIQNSDGNFECVIVPDI
jgi:SHS2 domain-containing protein